MTSDKIELTPLISQLRIANALLAAQLRQVMAQNAIVELLHGVGATNAEIATILGTTEATVRSTVNRSRKRPRS